MFKQTKRHSRAFSCGYVYHIKVKIPVGYVTLTVVTGLLFEKKLCILVCFLFWFKNIFKPAR